MNRMSLEHSDLAEIQRASEAVEELRVPNTGKGTASGYSCSANRTMFYAKNTTADADITRRRWFPANIDPSARLAFPRLTMSSLAAATAKAPCGSKNEARK